MEPGSTDGAGRSSTRAGWRPWLRVAAAGVALLLASEALWLWQTWPVRELLLQPGVAPKTAGLR